MPRTITRKHSPTSPNPPRGAEGRLRSNRRYSVNVRLLLVTLTLVIVALPVGYLWYKYQLRQTASAFLARAEALEKEGEWSKAATYYQRYFAMEPEDTGVLIKLVQAFAQGAQTPDRIYRLTNLLYQTLGRAPERDDLRQMLAEKLLTIGSLAEAETEARKLLDKDPELARAARRVVALARYGQADREGGESLAEPIEALIAAAGESPKDATLIETTAFALRQHAAVVTREGIDPATLADQLMDRLIEADPADVAARLARYRYRQRFRLPDAAADLRVALEKDPENLDAILLSAVAASETSADAAPREEVATALRKAIELAPQDPRAYLVLAANLAASDRRDEAVQLLQQGRTAVENGFDLTLALCTLQLETQALTAAEQTLQELKAQRANYLVRLGAAERGMVENRLLLLEARLNIARGQLRQAIPLLRATLTAAEGGGSGEGNPDWLQASVLLAETYAALGQKDQASEQWATTARAFPHAAEVIEPATQALLQAGDFQRAIEQLDEFAARGPLRPTMHIQQLQAHLGSQLNRPPDTRNWTEVESALEGAKSAAADRWETAFAEVEYLVSAKQDKAAALATLRSAESAFAKSADFWRNAVRVYQALGETEEVARALDRHRQLASSPLDDARLRAAVLVGGGKWEQADAFLAETASSLSDTDRPALERLRVELLAAAGKTEPAIALVEPLLAGDEPPADLLAIGIEIALATNKLDLAKAWEAKLVQATDNGPDARFLYARRLLQTWDQLTATEKQGLEQTILDVRTERPKWSPIWSLAGDLAQVQGDPRQALEAYRSAIALGDRNPRVFQQLVGLLLESGQLDEAQATLEQLARSAARNPALDVLAIELAARQQQTELALKLARESAANFPDDPIQQLYLADLLARNDQAAESLEVLREASRRFGDDPRVWLGLFTALQRAGELDEARAVLATMIAHPKLAADQRHFVAAQGYERLEEWEAARQQYELAVREAPTEVPVRLAFARLMASRDPRVAREQLETALQAAPGNPEIRRELAILLAASGQPADWQRANQLLDTDSPTAPTDAATSDRLRALLLAQRGRTRGERLANSQAARKILAERIQSAPPGENELNRLLLAQLYEQEAVRNGDASLILAAQEEFRTVIEQGAPNAERLSQYIEFLLRYAEPEKASEAAVGGNPELDRSGFQDAFLAAAEAKIADLERLLSTEDPGQASLYVALSARLRKARGHDREAYDLVADFVTQQSNDSAPPNVQARQQLLFGRLFSSIGAHADAETWFRRLAKENPSAYVLVMDSLVQQGKRKEAVEYCLEISQGNPDAAMTQRLATLMALAQGEAQGELEALRPRIEAALQRHEENLDVLQAEAILRASREEYDQAIPLFRQIVARDPGNVLALNNLATLLAEKPNQHAEALEAIEQAITIAGRQPYLLDTQGTILLKLGDVPAAIASLEEAVAGGTGDARYYLHLASAYLQADRLSDAQEALAEAKSLGLEGFVLTGDDRESLTRLEDRLKPEPANGRRP